MDKKVHMLAHKRYQVKNDQSIGLNSAMADNKCLGTFCVIDTKRAQGERIIAACAVMGHALKIAQRMNAL